MTASSLTAVVLLAGNKGCLSVGHRKRLKLPVHADRQTVCIPPNLCNVHCYSMFKDN